MPESIAEPVEEQISLDTGEGLQSGKDIFGKVNFDVLDDSQAEIDEKDTHGKEPNPEAGVKEPAGKPVQAAAGKPKEEPKTEATPEAKVDDDKDIDEIQPKPGTRPDIVNNISNLKKIAKAERSQRKALEPKVKELEDRVKAYETELGGLKQAPAVKPDEVKKLEEQIAQLQHYQSLIDPENSIIINKEFNEKLKVTNGVVSNILKSYGLPEKAEGGGYSLERFNQEGGVTGRPMSWWMENVVERKDDDGKHVLPIDARKRLEAKILEAFETEEAKKAAISTAPDKLKEHAEKLSKDKEAKTQADINVAASRIEKIQKENDWARKREVPAGAPEDLKKHIEEHNKLIQEAETLFPKLYHAETPEQKVDMAAAYCYAGYIEREYNYLERTSKAQIADLTAKLASAEEKLTGIKKAGATRAEKAGGTVPPAQKSFLKMTTKDTFAALDE